MDERSPLSFSSQLTVPIHRRDHVIGPPDALISLVEYADFECPPCGKVVPIVDALLEHFGSNIQYAYRHFPLTQMHPSAQQAAEAAEAAAVEGKFWEMYRLLYENQSALDEFSLIGYAEVLHLDPRRFTLALRTERFRAPVEEDFISGIRSGVKETPTFFLNNFPYEGILSVEALTETMTAMLKGKL